MASGEMICKWCKEPIYRLKPPIGGRPYSHADSTLNVDCNPEPAASSAIEVAPKDKYCPHAAECVHPCDDDECFLETLEQPNGPSVAPGEAQREPQFKFTSPRYDDTYYEAMNMIDKIDGRPDTYEPAPAAVPSEVAPSREQRLMQALREVRPTLENYEEIDGQGRPNAAMKALQIIDAALLEAK